MESLLVAVTDLVALLSPDRIKALAERMRGPSFKTDTSLNLLVTTPAARAALKHLVAESEQARVSGDVLAGILVGAAYAREHALRETKVELVWTGPTTSYVATRRTEQVLLDLIGQAQRELFLVSFVLYDVAPIVKSLNEAVDRGVEIRALLEASTKNGGSLDFDPVAILQRAVPCASVFTWTDQAPPFTHGSVHAKIVVADDDVAFLSSANMTGYALERNMEAGVVVSGGQLPKSLRNHLRALVETKVIREVLSPGPVLGR